MFWIYPKADAGGGGLAQFSLRDRTPKPCSGLQKGSEWNLQPLWKAGEVEGQMLWTLVKSYSPCSFSLISSYSMG